MRSLRWTIFGLVAVGFFLVAMSGDVYNLTSPPTLSWHILLRKAYSIVAFALVGGTLIWASGASLRAAAITVALYSGLIEVGQFYFVHSNEGLGWNAFDVACGGVGGALAAFIPWVRVR